MTEELETFFSKVSLGGDDEEPCEGEDCEEEAEEEGGGISLGDDNVFTVDPDL